MDTQLLFYYFCETHLTGTEEKEEKLIEEVGGLSKEL
jgi:hypothetical protein